MTADGRMGGHSVHALLLWRHVLLVRKHRVHVILEVERVFNRGDWLDGEPFHLPPEACHGTKQK